VRLSIRWRLTLWNTLALATLLLGFAGLVYALMRHALYEQIDRGLLGGFRALERDERLARGTEGRLAYWAQEMKEHLGLFCVAYGPDGRVRARTEEMAEDSVPPAPGGTGTRDVSVPILGRQRALVGRLRAGDEEVTLLLLAPLDAVDQELGELRTALLTAVPGALAVAAGVAYLLARKALAPVQQLRRATREITAERLDRRLPVNNPADELGGLAAAINDMIARLERSFDEVRRFTADASHELRTPLTAIRTEVEVALARAALPPEQQHLLGSVLEECDRLARLTDQLLTLAREDAGAAPPTRLPVGLSALVCGVVEVMRPLAEARGLSMSVEAADGLTVCGDAGRLRQVLFNVVDNALKYTPEGGRIVVRIAPQEGSAVVTVSDTGVGIAAEHLPRVFDRFYRVDKARSREQGGTGLGLSISRSIVAAHGGRIDLDSAPGRGTTCTVILPLGGKDNGKE
jgi:heavy metal sensor kinase